MDAKGEQTAFVYTTYIQETPERVWQGLTDPALMKRYWRHQKAGPKTFHSDWKKGSTYEMAHDEVGLVVIGPEQVILDSDPPHRLAYTWHTITRPTNRGQWTGQQWSSGTCHRRPQDDSGARKAPCADAQ